MAEIKCVGTKNGEKEKILEMASHMFDGPTCSTITSITHMPGGLTNRNFKVEFEDGKKYAFRIAGEGTAEYLNRPSERDAVAKAQILGISPAFYWYDESTGTNICGFAEGTTMNANDFYTRKEVAEHAAPILRKIHTSGLKEINTFDPFAERKGYYEYLKNNDWTKFYEELKVINPIYQEIEKSFAEKPFPVVFSHNDCLAANFIFDEPNDTMSIIDWEYCGMNYYFFDLAALISENDMEEDMEEITIRAYFGGEPTEQQRAEVLIGKFLMDGLWIPWALVQSVTKVDERDMYWDWGYVRVKRCLKHMANPNWDKYLKMMTTDR